MQVGKLEFVPIEADWDLVGAPVKQYLQGHHLYEGVWVSRIDPELADTTIFCERYAIGLDVSANCVIVEAKRADKVWYAACLILATNRADINGVVRRQLDARKLSFTPMTTAITLTGMEYGGITPLGLPSVWPLLIDKSVAQQPQVIIGSGVRGSKILITTKLLASLPTATVLPLAKAA